MGHLGVATVHNPLSLSPLNISDSNHRSVSSCLGLDSLQLFSPNKRHLRAISFLSIAFMRFMIMSHILAAKMKSVTLTFGRWVSEADFGELIDLLSFWFDEF
jgi:hypothetical protein